MNCGFHFLTEFLNRKDRGPIHVGEPMDDHARENV